MRIKSLTLVSYDERNARNSITAMLFEGTQRQTTSDETPFSLASEQHIFADRGYHLELNFEREAEREHERKLEREPEREPGREIKLEFDPKKMPDICDEFADEFVDEQISTEKEIIKGIKEVRVYINDTREEAVYYDGTVRFSGERGGRVFMDCFGFVEITLKVLLENGTTSTYTTPYIPVIVHRDEFNESVKAMVDYVCNSREDLWQSDELGGRISADLAESQHRDLWTQIILAEEIATIYEGCFGYFKANSRFKIVKTPTIDQFEKLQYITPDTLGYIASHPEQLKMASGMNGIRAGNMIYQPQKTLSLQNKNTFDIYENRAIVGFLQMVIDEVSRLKIRCEDLLSHAPKDERYGTEYIYSAFLMYAETRSTLEKSLERLGILSEKLGRLFRMYQDIFGIERPRALAFAPQPTAIFMSVPQYNRVFVHMHRWQSYGMYDFASERYMLSFVKISDLYERYLLAKFVWYFENCGYELKGKRTFKYKTQPGWYYKNTRCTNTLYFQNESTNITLYYQPVIYDSDRKNENGIGLYRNNVSHSDNPYYAPDFIIKFEKNDVAKYLILDAKFSKVDDVKRFQLKELAYKYLFSISPVEPSDTVVGMGILCGKCSEQDKAHSAYNRQLPSATIYPLAEILPMMESIDMAGQTSALDELLGKVLGK